MLARCEFSATMLVWIVNYQSQLADMAKDLTIKQFASLGGKARWKGIGKKARSKAMKQVRSKSNPQASTKDARQASTSGVHSNQ